MSKAPEPPTFVHKYVEFLNRYKAILLVFYLAVTVGIAIYGIQVFSALSQGGNTQNKAPSVQAIIMFDTEFYDPSPDLLITLSHDTWTVDDPRFMDAYWTFKAALQEAYPVTSIISTFDYPEVSGLVSSDRHMTLVTGRLPADIVYYPVNPIITLEDFQKVSAHSPLTVHYSGNMLFGELMSTTLGNDLTRIEQGATPVLLVLLVVAYGSIGGVLCPIVMILWTIVATLFALKLVTLRYHVTVFVTDVTAIFGAGLAIDFSLFMHLRFKEELEKYQRDREKDDTVVLSVEQKTQEGLQAVVVDEEAPPSPSPSLPPSSMPAEPEPPSSTSAGLASNIADEDHQQRERAIVQAVIRALQTSGRTVSFSGVILTVTLCSALQFHEFYLTTMSLGIIFPACFACIGAITIIPTIYLALGWHINFLALPQGCITCTYFTRPLLAFFQQSSQRVGDVNQHKPLPTEPPAPAPVPPPPTLTSSSMPALPRSVEEVEESLSSTTREYAIITKEEDINGAEGGGGGGGGGGEEEKGMQLVPLPHADEDDNAIAENQNSNNAEEALSASPPASPPPSNNISNFSYESDEDRKDIWFATVTFVMKWPIPFGLALTACFVALTVIFFAWGNFGLADYGNLPLNSQPRQVYEDLAHRFPAYGQSSLDVFLRTVESNGTRSPLFLTKLDAYCSQLELIPEVVGVSSIVRINTSWTVADYIQRYQDPFTGPYSNSTRELVDPFFLTDFNSITRVSISLSIIANSLRAPRIVRKVRRLTASSFLVVPPSSSSGHPVSLLAEHGVTGNPAFEYDLDADLMRTIPHVVAAIICSMFVFLVLLTGSVVIPIKAIITSVMSLFGSFGFLLLVMQNNHGDKLLHFHNDLRCLDPEQMIFIFIVAFGLSLDYEVFLLGRIREIYLKTGDPRYAVAKGIQTSARTVTMAAILLCTAVGGFLSSEVLILQEIGMGIGLTIVLDATVTRCILVPAFLALLGDFAWYAPPFVKKIVEYLDLVLNLRYQTLDSPC